MPKWDAPLLTVDSEDDNLIDRAREIPLIANLGKAPFYGGLANDSLVGGSAKNTFIFGNNNGNKSLEYFAVAKDTIRFSPNLSLNNRN